MSAEPVQWSEEKQQHLQEQLTGCWSEDIWELGGSNGKKCYLRFSLISSPLKAELKYALWYKFDSGEKDATKSQNQFYSDFAQLVAWLNQVAPTTLSLLEKPLEYWEWSLRSYLIETKRFRPHRFRRLTSTQEYVEGVADDSRIGLFRQCYKITADAYDDREEVEKDCWDMRKMGLAINLTISDHLLNFTPIAQSWLKHLAKEFTKYNLAVHSPGDSSAKLIAIRAFSQFLAECTSQCHISDVNRTLIVAYISFLQKRKVSGKSRNQLLSNLRVFLEVCAHRLQTPGLTKEPLIFDDDLAKVPQTPSREIPEEVLVQIREHLNALPTTILRMVTILLEVGMRISELCTLPLDCLICDDKHEWYLRFYQSKVHKEHIVPLVDEKVIGTIQAQQQEIRHNFGTTCPYLFPSPRRHTRPFGQNSFRELLNAWAVKHKIKDQHQQLYRLTAHSFRHTVGMRLLNDDVPLEVVSRLLGHSSLRMTEIYARVRDKKMRADLERAALKRKTVDAQGHAVKGDPRANDPDAQLVRKGVRGQTLPVGGCGRLIVLGDCSHANKCLTCPMWLTSTDDLPKLKSFYERAVRLKQRAVEKGNQFVIDQQEHIISALTIRIKSLEAPSMDGTLAVDEVLEHLRADLAEAEIALEEVRAFGLVPAAKYLERTITDLKAKMAALEEAA